MNNRKLALTAIIYDKKGRVLSVGQNSYTKTHPLQAAHAKKYNEHKVFQHAEISAIIRCPDLSLAHRIRVFRYSKSGEPMPSAPCLICRSAISATPIKYIEHT